MILSFASALVFPPALPVLIVLWALAMIALPIVSFAAPSRRATAVTAAVIVQAALVVYVLLLSFPVPRALLIVFLVPLLGWGAEFTGSTTGIPFGSYHYTTLLRPRIAGVPLAVPLAWLMMMPPSWAIGTILVPEGPAFVRGLLAAAAFTAWDLYLDPQMVGWGYWIWKKRGAYQGIPISNFVGWFLWALVISLAVCCWGPGQTATIRDVLFLEPLVLIYLAHWVLQFGGHMFFWRMPVSAIAGFLGMGALAVPALLRYFSFF